MGKTAEGEQRDGVPAWLACCAILGSHTFSLALSPHLGRVDRWALRALPTDNTDRPSQWPCPWHWLVPQHNNSRRAPFISQIKEWWLHPLWPRSRPLYTRTGEDPAHQSHRLQGPHTSLLPAPDQGPKSTGVETWGRKRGRTPNGHSSYCTAGRTAVSKASPPLPRGEKPAGFREAFSEAQGRSNWGFMVGSQPGQTLGQELTSLGL